jgi:hypothetical protein
MKMALTISLSIKAFISNISKTYKLKKDTHKIHQCNLGISCGGRNAADIKLNDILCSKFNIMFPRNLIIFV